MELRLALRLGLGLGLGIRLGRHSVSYDAVDDCWLRLQPHHDQRDSQTDDEESWRRQCPRLGTRQSRGVAPRVPVGVPLTELHRRRHCRLSQRVGSAVARLAQRHASADESPA